MQKIQSKSEKISNIIKAFNRSDKGKSVVIYVNIVTNNLLYYNELFNVVILGLKEKHSCVYAKTAEGERGILICEDNYYTLIVKDFANLHRITDDNPIYVSVFV